jgi:hypothetical protein
VFDRGVDGGGDEVVVVTWAVQGEDGDDQFGLARVGSAGWRIGRSA